MFAKQNKNRLIYRRLCFNLWSWRDSNPRPNKQYISFLHAYSTIGFRLKAESRHPTSSLSSKVFVFQPKLLKPYFRIPISQNQTPQNRAFVEYLASLLKSSGKRLNLLYFDIKLQERTLRCQLKFCSKGLQRSRHGSLHAYLPIGLAVETSQPHE